MKTTLLPFFLDLLKYYLRVCTCTVGHTVLNMYGIKKNVYCNVNEHDRAGLGNFLKMTTTKQRMTDGFPMSSYIGIFHPPPQKKKYKNSK